MCVRVCVCACVFAEVTACYSVHLLSVLIAVICLFHAANASIVIAADIKTFVVELNRKQQPKRASNSKAFEMMYMVQMFKRSSGRTWS